jgi:aspartyl-tRNA(Asn)/glutamyl-tRNA(Gln) amidotransferase subunit C
MEREPSRLSAQEIRTTAELARLHLTDAEIEPLRTELSALLAYAAQLAEVDVAGVPPMTHAVERSCPLRADVVGPSEPTAAALANAPATAGAFFVVPAVFASAGDEAAAGPPDGGGSAGPRG